MVHMASLKQELQHILTRDPAARSLAEVALCYPGFHAMLAYRVTHYLWQKEFKLLARFLSQVARFFTGIEIHPGATIGDYLFIDHGFGVVIGETAIIGNHVTLYHDVTLGGTSLNHGKRHPTLEDEVIVGAGAQVLGPITVGKGAHIGANAVVVKDVKPGVSMVGVPAREVLGGARDSFCAYGIDSDHDPLQQEFDRLKRQLEAMERKMKPSETDGSGI